MNTDRFIEWLSTEKSMGVRSAKDVVSRCGRVCRLLGIDGIEEDAVALLMDNDEFCSKSTFIRSQLKRAVSLYIEFSAAQEN